MEQHARKLIYLGPGYSGKTTNLQYLYANQAHDLLPPAQLQSLGIGQSRVLSLGPLAAPHRATNGDRGLWHLYTMPQAILYPEDLLALLHATHGIVFVADAQPEKLQENVFEMQRLTEYLVMHGRRITDIPLVVQYTKQDLPRRVSIEELERQVNTVKAPYVPAIPSQGIGVIETFQAVVDVVLQKAEKS